MSRIRFTSDGCWEWTGARSDTGYGNFWDGSRVRSSHGYAYEQWVGPVPEGMELDHLCRNRACANPTHLEPVTATENVRRGLRYRTTVNGEGLPTHCVNGHPWNDANTYVRPDNGKRACRACKRERMRRYKAERRAA